MKTNHNFVANDLIWKDHIHKEYTAAGQWDVKWGLLASFISNEVHSGQQESPLTTKDRKTSARGSLKQNSKKREDSSATTPLKLPPITNCGVPHKNCKPFPQTTTQFIGWKSKDPENNLERYGKYTKPTKTFLSEMNWPYEAMV